MGTKTASGDIVIFGLGDVAQLAHFYFSKKTNLRPVAFTVDKTYITSPTFLGLPVVDFAQLEKKYDPKAVKIFIAIGYSQGNDVRRAKYFEAKKKGYAFATYVHPNVEIYENVTVGENCFILEDNTIQPFVRIGHNVVLWSGNHIGHHSTIGDHTFVASHVVISGHTTIGENCFLGVNATLRNGITVAKGTTIGAGAVLTADTKENELYAPPKVRRVAARPRDVKI